MPEFVKMSRSELLSEVWRYIVEQYDLTEVETLQVVDLSAYPHPFVWYGLPPDEVRIRFSNCVFNFHVCYIASSQLLFVGYRGGETPPKDTYYISLTEIPEQISITLDERLACVV